MRIVDKVSFVFNDGNLHTAFLKRQQTRVRFNLTLNMSQIAPFSLIW